MTYEEICNALDIESICVNGIYPLDIESGEQVAGGPPYTWERERFFMIMKYSELS